MTGFLSKSFSVVFELAGKAVVSSNRYRQKVWIATLSVAETLLEFAKAHVVTDVNRMKEDSFRRLEASTDQEVAKAEKTKAEAREAANKADMPKRDDAFARLESERLRLENAKTQAEVDAIERDSETKRLVAMAEAQAKLIQAISALRQAGGDMLIDGNSLREILKLSPPEDEAE